MKKEMVTKESALLALDHLDIWNGRGRIQDAVKMLVSDIETVAKKPAEDELPDQQAMFESWAIQSNQGFTLKGARRPDGVWYYFDDEENIAWDAWCASRQMANKEEVEQDKIDAKRYRWLQGEAERDYVQFTDSLKEVICECKEALDEAIDSAMGFVTHRIANRESVVRGKALEEAAKECEKMCKFWFNQEGDYAEGNKAGAVDCANLIRQLKRSCLSSESSVGADERIDQVTIEKQHEVIRVAGSLRQFASTVGREIKSADVASFAAEPSHVSVPEGWKVVPVEPTDGMKDAPEVKVGGCYSCRAEQVGWSDCAQIYRAMVACAPSPEKESK